MTLIVSLTLFAQRSLEKNIDSEVKLAWNVGTVRWKKKCVEKCVEVDTNAVCEKASA